MQFEETAAAFGLLFQCVELETRQLASLSVVQVTLGCYFVLDSSHYLNK